MKMYTIALLAITVLLAGCGGGGGNSGTGITPPPGSNPVPHGTYNGTAVDTITLAGIPPQVSHGTATFVVAADNTVSGSIIIPGQTPAAGFSNVAGVYVPSSGATALTFGSATPDFKMVGAMGYTSGKHVQGTFTLSQWNPEFLVYTPEGTTTIDLQ